LTSETAAERGAKTGRKQSAYAERNEQKRSGYDGKNGRKRKGGITR
jgi:hypothetical protein